MKIGTLLLACAAVILTLLSGLWQGQIRNRWGAAPAVAPAIQALEEMPREFGSWQSVRDLELEKTVVEILECSGYVHRLYQHKTTGQVVNVVVLLGPPGPISVHTPEVCYAGQGFEAAGERRRVELAAKNKKERNEFWSVRMNNAKDASASQEVLYAWSTGGAWETPESPRWTYRRQPYLYKIQAASLAVNNGPLAPMQSELASAAGKAEKKSSEEVPTIDQTGLEDFVQQFVTAAAPNLRATPNPSIIPPLPNLRSVIPSS